MKTLIFDSFETGFFPYRGISELECPNQWAPDWIHGNEDGEDDEPGINVRPEYKPKHQTPEVRTGDWSASIHSREATHRGVLFRQFEAEPGKYHTASVWAMGLTGPKGKSGHGMRIGVDPTGRLDFRGDTVQWGDWYSQYRDDEADPMCWEDGKWVRLSKVAHAENDRITVFLWSSNDYKKDVFAHFDDFLLEVEGDGEQPQPPPSGDLTAVIAKMDEAIVEIRGIKELLQEHYDTVHLVSS